MFLRISSAVLLAALAGCSSQKVTPETEGQAGKAAPSAVTAVPCALADAKTFTASCEIERRNIDGKFIVTVRHPDGGFRRLVELDGGKAYSAADGSDEVALEANGKEIELTLGDDHYLFPAPAGAPPAGTDAAKP